MNPVVSALCFLGCVLASSCSQILLKKGALKNRKGIWMYLNSYVIIGYSIFLSVTLFSTYLYKFINLSVGTLLDSSGYIFVTVLSALFLKEKISKRKTLGICLIVGGILICLSV